MSVMFSEISRRRTNTDAAKVVGQPEGKAPGKPCFFSVGTGAAEGFPVRKIILGGLVISVKMMSKVAKGFKLLPIDSESDLPPIESHTEEHGFPDTAT